VPDKSRNGIPAGLEGTHHSKPDSGEDKIDVGGDAVEVISFQVEDVVGKRC